MGQILNPANRSFSRIKRMDELYYFNTKNVYYL